MKQRVLLSLSVLALSAAAVAQQAPSAQTAGGGPASSPRSDLYSVYFVKAAPGKAAELLKALQAPDPSNPMQTHALILKHLDGDDWDYAVIGHLGTKFTLDASTPIGVAAERELRAWHYDTYAQGPSWAEFSRAMGIGQSQAGGAPAGSDVYVVSDYRGAAGHRAQLEDTLKKVAASSLRPADTVLLQHRDGSDWDYLYLTRYNGFKDYAFQQEDPDAPARFKRVGLMSDPGLALRDHMAAHHDTITVRIPVQSGK